MIDRVIKVTLVSIAATEDIGCMLSHVPCLCTQLASRKVTESKEACVSTMLLNWSQCAILFHIV